MGKISELTDIISRLPGIGPKSSRRIVSFLLKSDKSFCDRFSSALTEAKERVHACPSCGMWTEDELCDICSSSSREHDKLCVVETGDDIGAIESCGIYRGLYHVLGGRISPMNGVYPENLSFAKLEERVKAAGFREIIIATNPNEEGDVTAEYARNLLKPLGEFRFTRLSSGIQSGGDIEYASERALMQSILGRTEM